MKFHPYSEGPHLISGADFDALVADIKENGLREKIWLYEKKILDGRNRFAACKKAGVEPKYREFRGDQAAALKFVASLNRHRRHENESQRAMYASWLKEQFQSLNLGSGKSANLHSGDTTQAAAAEMNVSRRNVFHADKVRHEGSKALQQAVKSGEISVSKAAKVVDLPKSEQLKAATQKQEAPKAIEVAPEPDFDFTDYEPEDDDAYKKNIENVMMADDKLTAMREELKQVHREMQGLKASRDHYQSEAGAAVRLVKARDREIEKLKKELAKARNENEALRERVAIMEAA